MIHIMVHRWQWYPHPTSVLVWFHRVPFFTTIMARIGNLFPYLHKQCTATGKRFSFHVSESPKLWPLIADFTFYMREGVGDNVLVRAESSILYVSVASVTRSSLLHHNLPNESHPLHLPTQLWQTLAKCTLPQLGILILDHLRYRNTQLRSTQLIGMLNLGHLSLRWPEVLRWSKMSIPNCGRVRFASVCQSWVVRRWFTSLRCMCVQLQEASNLAGKLQKLVPEVCKSPYREQVCFLRYFRFLRFVGRRF